MTDSFLHSLFSLSGKTIFVTGAPGHLCSAICLGYLKAGANVVASDIRFHKAAEFCSSLPEFEGNLLPLHCDVTSKQSLTEALERSCGVFGSVDVLLNGAGANSSTPFLEISTDDWDSVVSSQLTGTFLSSQIFGSYFTSRKAGSIINFSSASASPPLSKAFAYSAAKSAIVSLTKNLAREWALDNVRVNALRPGFFPTQWNIDNFIDEARENAILNHTPMKRFGIPTELVGAAIWLASDSSCFVTGSEVTIDGGFSAMSI